MNPEESPAKGVRRVNNVPLYLIGMALVTFLVIMIMVVAGRSEKNRAAMDPKDEVREVGAASMFASEIAGEQISGIVAPATQLTIPEFPVAETNTHPNMRQNRVAQDSYGDQITPAAPDLYYYGGGRLDPPSQDDSEADAIRVAKMQMLETAINAPTAIQIDGMSSSGSGRQATNSRPLNREEMVQQMAVLRNQAIHAQDDVAITYRKRMEQIRSLGLLDGVPGGQVSVGSMPLSPNIGGNYSQAGLNSRGEDRWRLDSVPEAPRSPFELRAGAVIPAILTQGINSDLPGQITAQISQDVYDTATGRHLLFPQGGKLVGTYDSQVSYGQSRVLIAWHRITFPDGKAMDIGSMQGADGAGYSGFRDKVNNHYFKVFSSAFLMSGIIAGVSLSQDRPGRSRDAQRASDALSESLGQQLGQVAGKMIEKNLNISPTLEIRPGYRFNVVVTKDLTLPAPYTGFDY